jgi:hypothetical protein
MADGEPVMKLVKYRWQNKHGYWPEPEFMLVPIDAGDERQTTAKRTVASLREYASSGKPSMSAFEVVEQMPLPEDIRMTGCALVLKAHVILYDAGSRRFDCARFIERMRDRIED